MYAVMVARHKMFPDYKEKGLKALPQLVLYTSEHVSQWDYLSSLYSFPLFQFTIQFVPQLGSFNRINLELQVVTYNN